MRQPLLLALFATLLLPLRPAVAELHVVACEPEWAALATALGGGDITVFSAATGRRSPHQPPPGRHLATALGQADLLVCTGAGLESEWLPSLLGQVKNPRIQEGRPGHFAAADHVELRGGAKPRGAHRGGNPHIQLDPHNIVRIADALTDRFIALDPQEAGDYRFRHTAFIARWQVAMERWEAEAQGLRGIPWVVHDTSWLYLEHWLGLVRVATLEPEPGVAPTPARLAELLDGLKKRPAKLVVRAPHDDPQPAAWLAQQAAIPVVVLPLTIGSTPAARDLFTLFDDILDRLLATRPRRLSWPRCPPGSPPARPPHAIASPARHNRRLIRRGKTTKTTKDTKGSRFVTFPPFVVDGLAGNSRQRPCIPGSQGLHRPPAPST